MLSIDQINELKIKTQDIIDNLTDWILRDICRRISEAGTLTSTAQYQIWRLKNLSIPKKQIEKEIKRRTGLAKEDIKALIEESAKQGYKMDADFLGVEAVPFENNAELLQILKAAEALADDEFNNITQTMGFVLPDGQTGTLTTAYQRCCDFAHMQVATGATDYATAVKNATRNLVHFGVQTISYESGQRCSVEAAVRRSVFGGVGLMQEKISENNHDTMGANGWELSAHAMSAPDHEPYQGRQYTDEQYQALQSQLKRRIGTLNCGHIAFPIILGISKPIYSEKQLKQMAKDNAKGVTYQGKHYTKYEATQKQRQIERTIRAQKRRIIAAEAAAKASGDNSILKNAETKLQRLYQLYNDFSKHCGLRPQYARFEMGFKI